MLKPITWRRLLQEGVLFCLPALLLSLFIGHLGRLLALSLLAALMRNYYFQLRLSHWLWRELAMLFKRFRRGADSLVMLTGAGHIFWCNGLAQPLLSFRWPEDNGQPILNLLRYPEVNDYLQRQVFQHRLHCS